ncbi:hypothetical protein ACFL51_00780 [Myxococcota bacterium]
MRRSFLYLGVLLVASVMAITGCRDDDNGNGNVNNNSNVNNNNQPDDDTIYQVQDPDHPSYLQEGDLVRIEEVIVTAVDSHGDRTGNVWVQEPDGGPFSGVMVYGPAITNATLADLAPGDLVTVTGEIDEFALEEDTSGRRVTEIANGSIEYLGQAAELEPEEVSAPNLMNDPDAEQWEGVLVRAVNVRATEKTQHSSYNDVTFTGGLVIQDDLYDCYTPAVLDTCYAEITGVQNYFFSYFVLPRRASDIVEGNDQDCEQVTPEVCDDGVDNDADGFTDCDDYDCRYEPECMETECADGLDNDGDGDTDCDDQDCLGTVECPAPAENSDALCADGVDNDGDTMLDCEDPSCRNHPDVTVCPSETNCTDGLDDDNDTYIDCDDFDCDADPACLETVCDDSVDNDGDGYQDCLDWDCYSDPVCDASQEVGDTECTDGTDNDGDGYTDCDDWSCQATYVNCVESDCSDGVDNDGDGYLDCDDFDCSYGGFCPDFEGDDVSCADGLDNDANSFTDCDDFNCRCCADNGCTGTFRAAATCLPCG